MWRSLVCSLVLAAVSAPALAAEAPACAPRKLVVNQLADKFGEQPVAIGVSDNGRLVEVLAGQSGGTFTVIMTNPQGVSCIVLTGDSWQARLAAITGPET